MSYIYYYGVIMGISVFDNSNYSPVGDLVVIATCFVFIILLSTAYVSQTRLYSIFKAIILTLTISGFAGLLYHYGIIKPELFPIPVIYAFRVIYHTALYSNLLLYLHYTLQVLRLNGQKYKNVAILSFVMFILLCITEVLGVVLGFGFSIDKNMQIIRGFDYFALGYILFVSLILGLLIANMNRIFKQIILSVILSTLVSFMLIIIQTLHGQASYTTVTFLFPVIALMYLIHSNPYDIEIGSLDLSAFNDYVNYYHHRKKVLVIMSLYLWEFDGEGKKYPHAVQEEIRKFAGEFFKGANLFQVTNGRMVLAADIERNANYDHVINLMLNAFQDIYPKYGHDFKIVILKSMAEISEHQEYVSLIKYIENSMPINDIHYFENDDLVSYKRHRFIVEQLEDIHKKRNLDDERVLVYCQPVFNIQKGSFDTAEALMRIRLPEIGMIYPNEFIPIAEEQGLIHMLSLIILNKTCKSISKLLQDGYKISRISVNFSIIEMRDEDFCFDVSKVIKDSGIDFDKIAIEITESQNEEDFLVVKEKIDVLRQSGMKFYLDDFGTGYSNFERIMELPFDIIKFDRSLVLASTEGSKSEKMVSHMARMFSEMNYSILYEGVESELDEEKCLRMSARYLQGFKYSKPIPIEHLKEYVGKTA